MKRVSILSIAAWRLMLLLLAAAPLSAARGAGISGRILLVGPAPEPAALAPGRDACCQQAAPVDESLVVGSEGGVANVLVSVEPRRGESTPPAKDPPREAATLTNLGCAFRPRVLLVRVGQPLALANEDPTMHNVNVGFVRNPAVNAVVEPGGRREMKLAAPERKPVAVRCNVHTYMRAWVVARADGHAAVTDRSGRFALPDLPAGGWRLRFWREGTPIEGLRLGGQTTDSRGEVVVEVPREGSLELGDLPLVL